MSSPDLFQNDVAIQWCPGCPNFGILTAVKKALAGLGLKPHDVCLVSGIGQAAKLPHYLRCHFFNGLHGRAIPVATGIHAANPHLTTLVTTGEGDCYGEGGNHLLHAFRRNPHITVIVHNNEIYALTKGQGSPTTPVGEIRSLHLHGVEAAPINMLAVAVAHRCPFVARGFALDPEALSTLIMEGVRWPGLALIEVIQPCITWGRHPLDWYRERARPIPETHDPTDPKAALSLLLEEENRFMVGCFYKNATRTLFGARFRQRFGETPLALEDFPDVQRTMEFLRNFRSTPRT
uniref:2-oxoacid ferredoxin oxidoreductase n=1 Tax=Desulfacinum infernum TaxID=35837 RepID=A0A832EIY8_9BACT